MPGVELTASDRVVRAIMFAYICKTAIMWVLKFTNTTTEITLDQYLLDANVV